MELHRACKQGDLSVVKDLLSKGVAVDTAATLESGLKGKTPLQLAAEYGHTAIVEVLLSAGADPIKIFTYTASAFHLAAGAGQASIVQQLLDAGADVDVRDEWGSSPLFWAAMAEDSSAVRLLIAAGANVNLLNNMSWTALHTAASYGEIKIIEQLLAAGADPCATNDDGQTPLDKAAEDGQLAAVKLLLQHADIPLEVLVKTVRDAAETGNTATSVLELLLFELYQRDRDATVEIIRGSVPNYSEPRSPASEPFDDEFNHLSYLEGWLSGMAASDAAAVQVRQALAKEKKELEDQRRSIQQLILRLAAMQKQQLKTDEPASADT